MMENEIIRHAVKITANISEFNAGIDKVVQKISLTDKEVGKYSRQMAKALNSISPNTQKVGMAMTNLNEQYRRQSEQLQEYVGRANESSEILAQLTARHTDEANAISKTQEQILNLKAAYEEANNAFLTATGGQSKSLTQYNKELERTKEKIAQVEDELKPYYQELEDIRRSTDEALSRTTTDDQARIELEIEAQNIAATNSRYDEKLELLEQLKQQYIDLQNITEKAQKAEALGSALGQANAQLKEQEKAISKTESEMTKYSKTADSVMQSAKNQSEAMTETTTSMRSYIDHSKALTRVKSFFEGLRSAVGKVAKEMVSFAGTAVGKFRKGITSLNSHIKKFASDGLKKAGNLVKKLGEHFKESHSKSNGLSDAVKKLTHSFSSLGSMLIRRFKRAIVSNIFNGLVDGIKSLAKESPEFNYAISSMLSALQQFANQLAAVVGPIVQAVAPVFTKLIQILTATTEKVAQFTAMITGNTTYKKAAPVNYDYAKSLETQAKNTDKTTKATKEATKETEKFKRSLLGFDELNILGSDEDTIGDDLANTIEDINDTEITPPKFETVGFDAVSDKLKKFVDDINGMFNSKDWNGLGHVMADAVNDAFEWIGNLTNWENCGERITEIINGITGTINGFVDGLDAEKIGGAIGEFVNTIVYTITLFIEGIDWYSIGSKFGDIVANIFSTVDWWGIGVMISDGVNGIIDILTGFVDTVPWEQTGIDVATAVYSTFSGIRWDHIGELIGKGLNGVISFLTGFVNTVPWGDVGLQLATFVNSVFDTINWSAIGHFISGSLNGIVNLFYSFLTNTKWKKIGNDFGILVRDTLTDVDWIKVGNTLMLGIDSAVDMLYGFVTTPGLFESIGTAFHDLLSGAIKKFPKTKWGETAAAIANGVFKSLSIAFSEPQRFRQFGEKVASNINAFFKNLKPEDFSNAINYMLRSFLEFAGGLIKNLDWDMIKNKVGAALAGINWGDAIKVFGIFFLIHCALKLPGIALSAAGILGTHLLAGIKGIDILSACSTLTTNLKTGLTEFITTGETLLKGAASTFGVLGLAVFDAVMVGYDVVKLKETSDGFKQAQEDHNASVERNLKALTNMYTTCGADTTAEFYKMTYDLDIAGMTLEEAQKALGDRLGADWSKVPHNMCEAFTKSAGEAFDGAVGAVKGFLGIDETGSSSVFDKIGQGTVNGLRNGLIGMDGAIDSSFVNVYNKLTDPFYSAHATIVGLVNSIREIGGSMGSLSGSTLGASIGGATISTQPTYHVDIDLGSYATGGFPEDGLFLANHNELVGSFGNGRTAVANNGQIVEGIKGGVQDAIAPFMLSLMSTIRDSNNSGGENVIEIDGERLARIVTRNQNRINIRESAF